MTNFDTVDLGQTGIPAHSFATDEYMAVYVFTDDPTEMDYVARGFSSLQAIHEWVTQMGDIGVAIRILGVEQSHVIRTPWKAVDY